MCLLCSLDLQPLRELKKLRYLETSARLDGFSQHVGGLVPFAHKLHLEMLVLLVAPNLAHLVHLKHLASLRLSTGTEGDLALDIYLSQIQKYLPELRVLDINEDSFNFPGKSVLKYLQNANHLMELRLSAWYLDYSGLNDFYERALEIVENRENKLPLKMFHRGQTIVRTNNLKLLHYEQEYPLKWFASS